MSKILKQGYWIPVFLFLSCIVWSFTGYEVPSVLLYSFFATALAYFVAYGIENHLGLFVLKRLGEAALTMLVISTLIFLLMRTLPGGPFDEEKALPPDVKANIEAKYKLNDPILKQYLDYMGGVLTGDLGESYKYIGRPITEIISDSLPNSIQLGIYALLISYLLGIPLGLIAANKHGTWIDSAAMITAISGVSLPSFLIAPIFVLIFAFGLGWLEPALWEGPAYYVLPMVVLGIRPAAQIARLIRASALDVTQSDFIRTARAKGLTEKVILFKHVFRNSMIPVLSLSGPLIAGILVGSFIIELIFAIPGVAKHFVQGVSNRDYPLILGLALLFSFLLIIANLITDLVIAIVDPRVKFS